MIRQRDIAISNREIIYPYKNLDKLWMRFSNYLHDATGAQNKYNFWTKRILRSSSFKNCDIVHLHLIQPDGLSLSNFKKITENKPTIWTWHDPWPLTGHCVYPDTCKNWKLNCRNCPDLSRPFLVQKDRAFQNRIEKYRAYKECNFRVHVSSKWMVDMINRSNLQLRHSPILLELPSDFNNIRKDELRKKFVSDYEIPNDHIVVGIRDTKQFQKNPKLIQDTLIRLPRQKLVFVSIDDTGLLAPFKDKFKIIELGHLSFDSDLLQFYSGLDIFLNLSTNESYGMMALEALLSGATSVCFANTATSEIVHKYGGVLLNEKNDLYEFLDSLKGNKKLINQSKFYVKATQDSSKASVSYFTSKLSFIYEKMLKDFNA